MEKATQVLPHHTSKLWFGKAEFGALYTTRPGKRQARAAPPERGAWQRRRGPHHPDWQLRLQRHLLPDPRPVLPPRGRGVPHHDSPHGARAENLHEQSSSPHQHLSAPLLFAFWGFQGATAGGARHHRLLKEDYCKAP